MKIGSAVDPSVRVRELQTGNPSRLSLLGVLPDPSGGQLERELHRYFKRFRVNGEWFEDGPELMRDIHDLLKLESIGALIELRRLEEEARRRESLRRAFGDDTADVVALSQTREWRFDPGVSGRKVKTRQGRRRTTDRYLRSPALAKGYWAGKPSPNAGKKWPAELLTTNEVQSLMEACSARATTGVRNRALLTVLYRCGLKVGEALALRAKDVNFDTNVLTVRGRGGRMRVVGLDSGAEKVLRWWISIRASLGVGDEAPLLCTLEGGELKSSYVRQLLPRLAKKAGIEKRCHPEALRTTFVADLISEGSSITDIQAQLGLESAAAVVRLVGAVAMRLQEEGRGALRVLPQ